MKELHQKSGKWGLVRNFYPHHQQEFHNHQTDYMNTNKIIGTILIIVSLIIGYTGINKVSQNDASVKVLGLKIDASNESGKNQGFIYIGLAAIMFIGGIVTLNRKAA